MTAKDIIRLNMHKNAEGKWHCPVTFKVRPTLGGYAAPCHAISCHDRMTDRLTD